MKKYHINPETGNVGICKAKKQCRFGGEHFETKQAAQEAFEKANSQIVEEGLGEVKEVETPTGMKNVSAPDIGFYFTNTHTFFSPKVEELANDWVSLRESHPELNEWNFVITSYNIGETTSVAFTSYSRKALVVDDRWVEALDKNDLDDIIKHEVAHILVGNTHENGHSEEWKNSFKELGGSGDEIMNEEITRKGLDIIHKNAEANGYSALDPFRE